MTSQQQASGWHAAGSAADREDHLEQHTTESEAPSEVAWASGRASVARVTGGLLLSRAGVSVRGTLAVAGAYEPRVGDEVLSFADDAGEVWIVGVVRRAPRSLLDIALEDEALDAEALDAEAPEGALPKAEADASVDRVTDVRGQLLFEYDRGADRAVLHVAQGDLELAVSRGALRLCARDGIALESPSAIRAEVARGDGATSRIELQPGGEVSLVGQVLTAAADRAEVIATRIAVNAHQLESRVSRVGHSGDVMEVRVGRIVERARDVYREVERLAQTRAGKLRLVAQKTMQLVGENTLLKARDRMKVKGERIHLS